MKPDYYSLVKAGLSKEEIAVSEAVSKPESTESEQSANNTLIVYFSRWGNTEYPSDMDATTSASTVVDGDIRYVP